MKIIHITLVCTGMLLTTFSSCKKFVQLDLPNSQISNPQVFSDISIATSAIAGLYVKLREGGPVHGGTYGLSVLLSSYADEVIYTGPPTTTLADRFFYQNNILPTNTTISTIWKESYNLIYDANAILEGLDKSTGIAKTDKEQLQGEALFIRAYIHFYLYNIFGNIPYLSGTDYRLNTIPGKLDSAAVYKLIIADLKLAKTMIQEDYVTPERVRVNRGVIAAMLARVYLYTRNWEAAKVESSEIIQHTALYNWVDDLDNVFLKESSGTLWQFAARSPGTATYEAENFNLTGVPAVPHRVMSDHLLNSFEPGDLRRIHWVGILSNASGSWHYSNKYKQKNTQASATEYSILFRLEEQYLIRAEAKAMEEDISGAQDDLNKIRQRAGLDPTTASSKTALIKAILQERRVELFTELGHRFFDLKRLGEADAQLSAVKPGWKSKHVLWPIPDNELLLNANLKPQNTGY